MCGSRQNKVKYYSYWQSAFAAQRLMMAVVCCESLLLKCLFPPLFSVYLGVLLSGLCYFLLCIGQMFCVGSAWQSVVSVPALCLFFCFLPSSQFPFLVVSCFFWFDTRVWFLPSLLWFFLHLVCLVFHFN